MKKIENNIQILDIETAKITKENIIKNLNKIKNNQNELDEIILYILYNIMDADEIIKLYTNSLFSTIFLKDKIIEDLNSAADLLYPQSTDLLKNKEHVKFLKEKYVNGILKSDIFTSKGKEHIIKEFKKEFN